MRIIKDTFTVKMLKLVIGLGVMFSAFVGAEPAKNSINSTLPIKAADCLVVDKDKHILMIEEAISGKFSIPGGSIIGDESPEVAAKRETFEETGLVVNVGKQIARTYNSALYACELATPARFYMDQNGQRIVMVWTAPHFGKEVTRVLLKPDNKAMRSNYRFPEHKWQFPNWVPEVTPSAFVFSPGEIGTLIPFYESQLIMLQEWHNTISSNGLTLFLSKIVILIGCVFSPLFFLLTLPLIRSYHGHRALLIYGAGMLTMATFTLILSTVIVVPRPYFIDPVFGVHNTLGYTLPSTMVTLTTMLFGWVWMTSKTAEKQRKYRWLIAVCGVVSILFVSLKVLLLGEHYPTDVLVGIALGVAGSFGLHHVRKWRFTDRRYVLISARFWIAAFAVTAVIGGAIHKPHIIYLSAICLGVYSALMWLKFFPVYVSPIKRHVQLTFFSLLSMGVLAIVGVDHWLTARYAVNTVIVAVHCGASWSIAVWLLVVAPRVLPNVLKI
ncbi:bifunctional NUDIX hydrolase/phosphatase PAP2 family protein [Enterovibrio norvegicus]|uniref:bifunctional NUDIX hydrolase/phosphatase PAP2 family protein n=1 Tax=Enterovibrio norvegicus TaxID=188144 RepID=UPI001FCAD175|nr:NUDIX domain-containing protein [Enterovibrio norvegicus]